MLEFNELLKEEIKERLEEYESCEEYGCDIAYKLFEDINMSGSYTYSRQEAIEYINEWIEECAGFYEYWDWSTGQSLNVFANPEAFQVIMILEGASNILGQCKFIEENWNNCITLDKEAIKTIIEEIEDKEVIW